MIKTTSACHFKFPLFNLKWFDKKRLFTLFLGFNKENGADIDSLSSKFDPKTLLILLQQG